MKNYEIQTQFECCITCEEHDVIDECIGFLFCTLDKEEKHPLGKCENYKREKGKKPNATSS